MLVSIGAVVVFVLSASDELPDGIIVEIACGAVGAIVTGDNVF